MQLELTAQTWDYPLKQRVRHALRFVIGERERAILEALYRYRVLDRGRIQDLFFDPGPSGTRLANIVLSSLYQAGYAERIARPVYAGPLYRLAARGAQLLARDKGVSLRQFRYWGMSDDRRSRRPEAGHMFLGHSLMLADIRVAIDRAVEASGCVLELWHDEMVLSHPSAREAVMVALAPGGRKERVPIVPDGYFVLVAPRGRGHFFLEADTGSEVHKRFRRKILGYKEYVLSRRFHRRYGLDAAHTALRVLTVTSSRQRAENLKVAAERYGPADAAPMFLFAALGDITREAVLNAPIWLRGGTSERQALL